MVAIVIKEEKEALEFEFRERELALIHLLNKKIQIGEINMLRKFEYVNRVKSTGYEMKEPKFDLPKRSTKNSAGYDIEAAEDITIEPFKKGDKPTLIATGLNKADAIKGLLLGFTHFLPVAPSDCAISFV